MGADPKREIERKKGGVPAGGRWWAVSAGSYRRRAEAKKCVTHLHTRRERAQQQVDRQNNQRYCARLEKEKKKGSIFSFKKIPKRLSVDYRVILHERYTHEPKAHFALSLSFLALNI
jgi:hypothetical protein